MRRGLDRGFVRAALFGAFIVGVAGCTLLVDFEDKPPPPCEGGDCADVDGAVLYAAPDADVGEIVQVQADANPCASLADGAVCRAADPCNDQARCVNGACVEHPKEAGTFCANDLCNCSYCDGKGACTTSKACPEGFNWDAGNKLARCCGGIAVTTDNGLNCGVCGIRCKTAGVSQPQSCAKIDGEYFCVDCQSNGECWSNCCSSTTKQHCAASANCTAGLCGPGICPAPSACVPGSDGGPNHCSY
jgi:hypothetical protein